LTSMRDVEAGMAIWVVVLMSGFIVMATLARDGCYLIWKHKAASRPLTGDPVGWRRATATMLLIAAGPLLAIGARPLSDYSARTAAQLHAPGAYVTGVLAAGATPTGRGARP
ncbi:MAG: Na+/H+ antiporter subunit D, partial [Candidatus Accumulibacter sp.]|nr:Na+/H+ antiporter subunit D [Accumulibacter sp.]